MTSHDNLDSILSDQKLHDLLRAEDEMERLVESKHGIPVEIELPCEEDVRESLL